MPGGRRLFLVLELRIVLDHRACTQGEEISSPTTLPSSTGLLMMVIMMMATSELGNRQQFRTLALEHSPFHQAIRVYSCSDSFAYLLDGVVDVRENLAGELIPHEVALTADGKGEEEQGQQRNPETVEELA